MLGPDNRCISGEGGGGGGGGGGDERGEMTIGLIAGNTPTRNYNLRSMRAWRREKAWF